MAETCPAIPMLYRLEVRWDRERQEFLQQLQRLEQTLQPRQEDATSYDLPGWSQISGRLDALHSVLANHGARLLEAHSRAQALMEHLGWQAPQWPETPKVLSESALAPRMAPKPSEREPPWSGAVGCEGDEMARSQDLIGRKGRRACSLVARRRGAQYSHTDLDRQVLLYARWRIPGTLAFWGALASVGCYYMGTPFTLKEQAGELLLPFCERFPQLVPLAETLKPPKVEQKEEVEVRKLCRWSSAENDSRHRRNDGRESVDGEELRSAALGFHRRGETVGAAVNRETDFMGDAVGGLGWGVSQIFAPTFDMEVSWLGSFDDRFFGVAGHGVTGFKNTYQSGFLSILYSIGSKPLQIWDKKVRNGHIKRLTDSDIQSSVLEIMGTNVSTTYITCPADSAKTLGIKLPFLVMIIKNLKKYFTFEVTVLDDKEVRRRFRASNYQSTTRVKPFICTMPMRLDEGWNQIQFNLSDFTRRAYGTNYIETLRVQLHANCRIRRIYFSDRLYSEEELPPEFKLFLPVAQKAQTAAASAPPAAPAAAQ
ncbi:unnamed protein product [Durusdinium trenchii]|uniref:CFA20 domain-containing protein n=1 Tax=Durusdinium trenchii TaxID=1381693 RepID=A0ABP0K828_9DINO